MTATCHRHVPRLRLRGAAWLFVLALLASPVESRAQTDSGDIPAPTMRAGEYRWYPERSEQGDVVVSISLPEQRLRVYRDAVEIGESTVSTGRRGYETPTGRYRILQKRVTHFSNKYDNAPMPHMQRLTWDGIALHGGHVPDRPASHGCVRLPPEFAKLLFQVTALGTTVVILDGVAEGALDVAGETVAEPPVATSPVGTDGLAPAAMPPSGSGSDPATSSVPTADEAAAETTAPTAPPPPVRPPVRPPPATTPPADLPPTDLPPAPRPAVPPPPKPATAFVQ